MTYLAEHTCQECRLVGRIIAGKCDLCRAKAIYLPAEESKPNGKTIRIILFVAIAVGSFLRLVACGGK
jgi:hypothetical protein